jgi:hypothetical protein
MRGVEFDAKVQQIVELLRTRVHLIPEIGVTEDQLYDEGYFRAAVEIIRGQYAASLSEKRQFLRGILSHMQDEGSISEWHHAENRDRHDYSVILPEGVVAVIEQKGCLDGNNVNISERPPHAKEFYIWSICTNHGSNLAKGVWSALMRLTADMVATNKRVDGVIVWDMLCGSTERRCPKLLANPESFTAIGAHRLPPPCIYLLPQTIGHARLNPKPAPHSLESMRFAKALLETFGGTTADINHVEYEMRMSGTSVQRKVRVLRDGREQHRSRWTTIRRVTG